MFCTKVWYSKLLCCCCFHKFLFLFVFIIVRKSFLSFFRLRNSFDNGDFLMYFWLEIPLEIEPKQGLDTLKLEELKKTTLGGGQCHKLTPSLSFFYFYLPLPPLSFFFIFSLSMTWVWTTTLSGSNKCHHHCHCSWFVSKNKGVGADVLPFIVISSSLEQY